MGLPTPEQLNELSGKVLEHGKLCRGKWEKFTNVLTTLLAKAAPSAAQAGVTKGASALGVSSGLQVGATVGGVAVGTTIAPVGVALAPWIAAATIASQAGKIFSLYDIKDDVLKGGSPKVTYVCHCGQCAKNIGYIIDKKERNVGLVAVGVFTLGASAVIKGVHSLGKKVKSAVKSEMRPKEKTCRDLIDSARDKGCTAAMATIFLLSGSWSFMGNREAKTMATAVAIVTSEDGWDKFKSLW